ncbi:MAG TPA: hypothetical protein VN695_05900 [Streptosporangiaceae bacterium]|nr:hypothetical protein [Streptosporangiaceae bacterium]
MVDDDITSIFMAVAQDIEPDMATVIAEATRQGRIRRARRRLAVALTAGVSVVAIAVAVTVAAQLASRTAGGSAPAGPGGHRHARATKPKAHHARPAVPLAHGPGMAPTQMLAVLRTLLPKGEVTYVAPYYMRGWLELNFDDSKGAVDMIVDVSGPETMAQLKAELRYPNVGWPSASQLRQDLKRANKRDELYCPNPLYKDEGKRPAGAPPITCTRSVLASGDIVRKLVTEADVAGYYDYAVDISRPDGVTVSIDVGNGTLEGTPHLAKQGWPWVDRAVPPGSLDFWETVVASPKWHL